MNKSNLTSLALALNMVLSPVQAEEEEQVIITDQREAAGLGGGMAVGAAVGGPVGAVVGAMLGQHWGRTVSTREQLQQTETELAALKQRYAADQARWNQQTNAQRRAQAVVVPAAQNPVLLANARPSQHINEKVLREGLHLAVHFRTDSEQLEAYEVQRLSKLARVLQAHPTWQVILSGHADPRGSESYNDVLSQRRVQAVQSHLMRAGVAAERFQTEALGERQPFNQVQDRESYPFERQVQVRFRQQED